MTTIVDLIRGRRLDAELAALLWLLGEGRVPVHVASPATTPVAEVVRGLASDPALVTDGPGATIEDVLRQPVPLRPATGAIVILDADGRVSSAHLLRPPLRDGAGHIRPQGPAVLAARVEADDRLEHFAWGVLPELAEALGRKAGDLEGDIGERATFLDGLAATPTTDAAAVADAIRHWPHLRQRAN